MITAEQVKDAMIAAGIDRVEHHECSICHYQCAYFRQGDQLYFDPGCYCTNGATQLRSWQDVADWINVQSKPEIKEQLMKAFGITV